MTHDDHESPVDKVKDALDMDNDDSNTTDALDEGADRDAGWAGVPDALDDDSESPTDTPVRPRDNDR